MPAVLVLVVLVPCPPGPAALAVLASPSDVVEGCTPLSEGVEGVLAVLVLAMLAGWLQIRRPCSSTGCR